ncbi:MAG: hypothetical protein EBX03_14120, partial [Rhodobacteraceae bacterium]|nr:hypothetical protein [Paracoccaceae bacterium]
MSFYTALTGLKGAQTDIATTSNNIANVGSSGFKKSRAEFGDIFGSRHVFLIGLFVFSLASILLAVSPNLPCAIFGR